MPVKHVRCIGTLEPINRVPYPDGRVYWSCDYCHKVFAEGTKDFKSATQEPGEDEGVYRV